jgi:hypothetical protein
VIKKLVDDSKVDLAVLGHGYSEERFRDQDIDYKTIRDYRVPGIGPYSLGHILRETSADLVLVGQSSQTAKDHLIVEQSAILAARELGIPAISVSDYWLNRRSFFSDFYDADRALKYLPGCITVIDDLHKELIVAEGFPEDLIVVTGNPHLDNLNRKSACFTREDCDNFRERIGLGQEVLFFYAGNSWLKETQGYSDLDNIRLINSAIQSLPLDAAQRSGLVVKLHPRTPEELKTEIENYMADFQQFERIVQDIDSQDLVLATDLTITPFSTLGVEAVCMGKPMISMQPNLLGPNHLSFLTDGGLVPGGYSDDDCIKLVRDAYGSKSHRAQLVDAAKDFRVDGHATERVAELVYDSLKFT